MFNNTYKVGKQKPTETELAFSSYLVEIGVSVCTRLVGERKKDDWVHDLWAVSIQREGKTPFDTDFSTGIGYRVSKAHAPSEVLRNPRSIDAQCWYKQNVKPHEPASADIFHSLVLDSGAVEQCFEDWADDYGYDVDSRKAEKTYEECKEVAFKVRAMFSREEIEKIWELLEYY